MGSKKSLDILIEKILSKIDIKITNKMIEQAVMGSYASHQSEISRQRAAGRYEFRNGDVLYLD